MRNYLAYAAKQRAKARQEYFKGLMLMGLFGGFIAVCIFKGLGA